MKNQTNGRCNSMQRTEPDLALVFNGTDEELMPIQMCSITYGILAIYSRSSMGRSWMIDKWGA